MSRVWTALKLTADLGGLAILILAALLGGAAAVGILLGITLGIADWMRLIMRGA